MRCFILYMTLLELILSGGVLSDDIQSDRRQPLCKKPFGKPGQTLVKSCTDKEVCTLNDKKKANWEPCSLPLTREDLKEFETDVDFKLTKIIRLLRDIVGPTTLLPSTMVTSAGPVWRLVYSLNTAGGLFSNLDEAKKKNINDPEADHFSILYDLETMRNKDGVFHFKLCYPEMKDDFPCNEWIQNSNPVTEATITGYASIRITCNTDGIGGSFRGLGLSSPSFSYNLIDAAPEHANWYSSIGTLVYWGGSDTVPGCDVAVKKVQLSVFYTPSG